MKIKIIFALMCTLTLIFSACTAKNENDTPEIPSQEETESLLTDNTAQSEQSSDNTPEIKEPVCVSQLSKENFLSPLENYSWEREYAPEYVVLHFTSAVVLSRDDPYNMETVRKIFEDNEISIHYIIDRNGNIECYIPENRAAWHAGRGAFAGDERLTNAMNKYSIGIEILAIGSQSDMSQYLTEAEYGALDKSLISFTDAQYTALKELVTDICKRNNIPFDRQHVIGHDEYNSAKTDPGELLEWERVLGE